MGNPFGGRGGEVPDSGWIHCIIGAARGRQRARALQQLTAGAAKGAARLEGTEKGLENHKNVIRSKVRNKAD